MVMIVMPSRMIHKVWKTILNMGIVKVDQGRTAHLADFVREHHGRTPKVAALPNVETLDEWCVTHDGKINFNTADVADMLTVVAAVLIGQVANINFVTCLVVDPQSKFLDPRDGARLTMAHI